ncbi:MAG: CPBP family intramembrane metalloprotease [Cyanobacteria bacterium NC_groundwater_1444_Ag_S-0.65um_54_12]|nr:CPBP family intramembrane metalloprotease [Cyanobacteria bacterium NC_groundwater_1444_Ag_S-0.65um_54_12]
MADRSTSSYRGSVSLLKFLVYLALAVLAWAVLLAGIFRIDLADVWHPNRIPSLVANIYVVGLYALLVVIAGGIWRSAGGSLAAIIRTARPLAFRHWIEGWLSGLGGLTALSLLEQWMGMAMPNPDASWQIGPVLGAVATGTLFALTEELLFRGFILGLLLQDLPRWPASMLSAVLFALAHLLRPIDPGQLLLSFLCLWCAGSLLAYCRLRTGTLWLGIGLHSSWIWYVTTIGQLKIWDFTKDSFIWTGGGSPGSGLFGLIFLGMTHIWIAKRFSWAKAKCDS